MYHKKYPKLKRKFMFISINVPPNIPIPYILVVCSITNKYIKKGGKKKEHRNPKFI